MKSFKEYLMESKKVYSFKVKVAGDLPEDFQDSLKRMLTQHNVITFDKMTTPVQESPMDFPELSNKEVTIFDLVVEYPITAPELINYIAETGIPLEHFRVRGSGEPSETDQWLMGDPSGKAILVNPYYQGEEKVKPKNYFGDDFNKSFLKELQVSAKNRKKELEQEGGDPDVLASSPKFNDKAGVKSAIGS
jgi:hypothetical protein